MWYLLVTANYEVLGQGTRHCSLDSSPFFFPRCPPLLQNKTYCGALEVGCAHIFQQNPDWLSAGVSCFRLNWVEHYSPTLGEQASVLSRLFSHNALGLSQAIWTTH